MAEPRSRLDWENPALTGRHRLPARAYFFGYASAELARSRDRSLSLGYVGLSGGWRFRLFDHPARVPSSFAESLHEDWDEVQVPHLWQFDGYGSPHYTDEGYPFPVDPPRVPANTPTGAYQRLATLSAPAAGEQVLLRLLLIIGDGLQVGGDVGQGRERGTPVHSSAHWRSRLW